MQIDILSLFPEYFKSPLETSILKRAIERDLITVNLWNIRSFSKEKRNRVDDRLFGGGPGMLMMAPPIVNALEAVKKKTLKQFIFLPKEVY